MAGETGGLRDGGGLFGFDESAELGGLNSNNIGSLLFDHGERVSGGADRLIGHDGNANALRNLTQGLEVIGRGWLFKQFHAGFGEDWQEA